MTIALLRVDERLIHGQVTVGWGSHLKPTRYVVVDDTLAEPGWEQELYSLGTPAGAVAEFLSVEAARDRLAEFRATTEAVVVLTRDLDHMLRLAVGGLLDGGSVNLGGIHHHEGRTQALPYLFLSDADRDRIRRLLAGGVDVSARELPGSHRTPARDLLDD